MPMDHLSALALFAFISTFTPGPNNVMLMTSGANIGFTRTIPHMAGIVLGFAFMVLMVGMGLTGVFHAYPSLQHVLKIACMTYLFYLAYKIATSKPELAIGEYQPLSFLQAACFQWVNPKGWVMALSTVSLYNSDSSLIGLAIIALTFTIVNIPTVTFWVAAGKSVQRLLRSPRHFQVFNVVMAGLLMASMLPILLSYR